MFNWSKKKEEDNEVIPFDINKIKDLYQENAKYIVDCDVLVKMIKSLDVPFLSGIFRLSKNSDDSIQLTYFKDSDFFHVEDCLKEVLESDEKDLSKILDKRDDFVINLKNDNSTYGMYDWQGSLFAKFLKKDLESFYDAGFKIHYCRLVWNTGILSVRNNWSTYGIGKENYITELLMPKEKRVYLIALNKALYDTSFSEENHQDYINREFKDLMELFEKFKILRMPYAKDLF